MAKIGTYLKNLSLRKTFMLYMLVFLILAAILSTLTVSLLHDIQLNIYYRNLQAYGQDSLSLYRYYSDGDYWLDRLCTFLVLAAVPVIFVGCTVMASFLFYHNKLKRPLTILAGASAKIAENDLDFTIRYDCNDEMGQLCQSFESMRGSLEKNNRELWRIVEERRRLSAAFAHDLRTPLTVLRGYTDLLLRYLPEDKIPKPKLLSTIHTMDDHVKRLENYVQSMSSMQRLSEIVPTPQAITSDVLFEQLKNTAEILCKEKQLVFMADSQSRHMYVDVEMVFQVFENVLANANRYALQKITVSAKTGPQELMLTVGDDGPGFSPEALQRAMEPFYREEKLGDKGHFGLGLNICKILCEKHGGRLILQNLAPHGAEVTATFSCY